MATTISSADLATRLRPATLLLFVFGVAEAQISTPPRVSAEYKNALGLGLSYGENLDKDADFWGWTVEYGRVLNESWTAGLSVTWDEETERFADLPDAMIRSYNLIGTISYNLTPRLALTTGLAKEFANDGNASRSMKFIGGDVSTGVSAGYSWPIGSRNAIGLSFAYEYNISQSRRSISVDLTHGWGF